MSVDSESTVTAPGIVIAPGPVVKVPPIIMGIMIALLSGDVVKDCNLESDIFLGLVVILLDLATVLDIVVVLCDIEISLKFVVTLCDLLILLDIDLVEVLDD